jgi:hypothetical protein
MESVYGTAELGGEVMYSDKVGAVKKDIFLKRKIAVVLPEIRFLILRFSVMSPTACVSGV